MKILIVAGNTSFVICVALAILHHKIPGHVGVPRQLAITGDTASITSSVGKARLNLPSVWFPLQPSTE
jgi:hypothetical protein